MRKRFLISFSILLGLCLLSALLMYFLCESTINAGAGFALGSATMVVLSWAADQLGNWAIKGEQEKRNK